MPESERIATLAALPERQARRAEARLDTLLDIAQRGLGRTYLADDRVFAHTARLDPTDGTLHIEGRNLRYSAMTALGLSTTAEDVQRQVLAGATAEDLARRTLDLALTDPDKGALALAVWAVAELGGNVSDEVRGLLHGVVTDPAPLETVIAAWTLSALLACDSSARGRRLAAQMEYRLRSAQHEAGVFPHVLPQDSIVKVRRHVGCFADQVYPIQALARYHVVTGAVDAVGLRRCLRTADL